MKINVRLRDNSGIFSVYDAKDWRFCNTVSYCPQNKELCIVIKKKDDYEALIPVSQIESMETFPEEKML